MWSNPMPVQAGGAGKTERARDEKILESEWMRTKDINNVQKKEYSW